MDYSEAEQVMNAVLDFVYGFMNDYPAVFSDKTGSDLSPCDVEAAFNKVKNG